MQSTTIRQTVLIGVLGLAVGGSTLAIAQRAQQSDYQFFDPIIEVKAAISQRYVEAPDEQKLQEGAIAGMLEALNDPYTVYVPPKDQREFAKALTGQFVGIGAQVLVQDGWLTIVTPLEDSPALKAGIEAGDRVVEVDGVSTFGKTVDQCIEMLTGEPGTPVKVIVERGGTKLDPITITRARIVAKSVEGFHRLDDGKWQFTFDPARHIAYIRLTSFTPTAGNELIDALLSLGADAGKLKGLVLDLRGNGGGVLEVAQQIADLFLKDGVIVSTKYRAAAEETVRARAEGTLPDFPIVVLVNGQSASASEVLAGALQDNGRAIVLGTRTFGKGSVQAVRTIRAGGGSATSRTASFGQLKMTEGHYYLPSGRLLHRKDDSKTWGVDPSDGFYVPMSDDDTIAMLRVRREEMIIRSRAAQDAANSTAPPAPAQPAEPHAGNEARWSDPAWIIDRLKDPQLAAAIKALQAKIDTGEWLKTGEAGPDSASAVALGELQAAERLRERLLREMERLERRISALESDTGKKAAEVAADLWPESVDVSGGRLEVFDKDGKPVATLKITGNTLERWLLDAGVSKDGAK